MKTAFVNKAYLTADSFGFVSARAIRQRNMVREDLSYRVSNVGSHSVSDIETITAILGSTERHLMLAETLVGYYGSMFRIAQADITELKLQGLSEKEALSLIAAGEYTKRISNPKLIGEKIEGPEDVASYFIPIMLHREKEQFHVLILNTANVVKRTQLVSEGNLNSSIVHPREVFRVAIIESAAAIIGLHNHPSGNPVASKEDIAITKQLVEAGRIIGIPFHDHIIIAGENFVSMAQKGYV